jgi:CheY-like chemotaxis protein
MSDKTKLMFVDDDTTFLEAQTAYFGARGYEVHTAEGCEDAMAMLANESPDMIFVDLMMEHSDSGFTLARRIRRDARFENVPLVMLSGVASVTGAGFVREQDSLRSWSRLDEFVDKPVSERQLLALVERRLSGGAEERKR